MVKKCKCCIMDETNIEFGNDDKIRVYYECFECGKKKVDTYELIASEESE